MSQPSTPRPLHWPLLRHCSGHCSATVLATVRATVLTITSGPTSKASRALADVRLQLKSGKTRKGRPLEPEDVAALEEKRDRIVAEMRDTRQKKLVARIAGHTASEADRVIREVPQAVRNCIAEELDKRLGPAPTGDLEEALAERA